MRRAVVAFVGVTLLTATVSAAMWRWIPLAALVADSDLAVVGVLSGVREWREGKMDVGEGRIAVTDVVFGTADPTQPLLLRWSSSYKEDSVGHNLNAGVRALWLLKRQATGDVRADHPGRVLPVRRAKMDELYGQLTLMEAGQRDAKLNRVLEFVKRWRAARGRPTRR